MVPKIHVIKMPQVLGNVHCCKNVPYDKQVVENCLVKIKLESAHTLGLKDKHSPTLEVQLNPWK